MEFTKKYFGFSRSSNIYETFNSIIPSLLFNNKFVRLSLYTSYSYFFIRYHFIILSFLFSLFFFSPVFSLKTPLRILAARDNLNRLVLSNDSRARRMSRSHFAYRARHGMRSHAWRKASSLGTRLSSRIYSHAAGDALCSGRRGLPSRSRTARACEANLSRGVPLAARYTADIVNRFGKWSKRLDRAVSAKSYNFDGPTAFVGKLGSSGVGTSTQLLEISSIGVE